MVSHVYYLRTMAKVVSIYCFLLIILACPSSNLVAQQTKQVTVTTLDIAKDTIVEDSIDYSTDTIIKKTAPYIARINPDPNFLKLDVQGKVYSAMVTEDGDTLILADLDDVSITSMRHFDSDADYKKYMKFRRYALKVYPYAKEAIRIFREVEYTKTNLKKRAYKKKLKELEKELKAEFEEPLSKLTKLQGKILIKMIEKETDKTMFQLLKGLKGRFTAFYWHQFSKLYSYDLKEGYEYGKYEILDAVLQDFDLSYRIENDTNLKYISLEDVREKSKKKVK